MAGEREGRGGENGGERGDKGRSDGTRLKMNEKGGDFNGMNR